MFQLDVTGGQQHKQQQLRQQQQQQQQQQLQKQQQQHQQRQQQQQQLQIGDLSVQLNHSLGYGSFGTVYKASYQGTPAAAKYLYHPVQDYESFKHTLETLQGLTHPNLVAYRAAAMCPSPQSRRGPILVMELMERNLTQFLKEAEHDIPIHLQVSLCLDVIFALAYLHSQQIVHGHLTSNNVLLVGTTAKVADFGMSKLLDTQSSVTQSASYLPPEARVSHLKFSEKSDIFSLGVLVVQIVTREVPTPTPQQQLASLSEVDRRQQHIKKIASTHPLRDIALQCLKDTAMQRPTAKKVVTKLNAVKYHPEYEDSLKQEREAAQREIGQLTKKLKSKEESVLKQKQESEELHHQLKDKDQKIADAEIQHQALKLVLESESERVQDLEKELSSKEEFIQEQIQKLQQQLEEKERDITSVQRLYGQQHQALQALRKELDEKVREKDEQIQACEMEVKKLLQQSSELEAWKKTIKDKISSLASAAEQ